MLHIEWTTTMELNNVMRRARWQKSDHLRPSSLSSFSFTSVFMSISLHMQGKSLLGLATVFAVTLPCGREHQDAKKERIKTQKLDRSPEVCGKSSSIEDALYSFGISFKRGPKCTHIPITRAKIYTPPRSPCLMYCVDTEVNLCR